ncbi:MAG: dTDP-4-dehydrorhamnose reductase [Candidatus Omnitrophica bacterium]|nr:dTDP-4-dehydrorhamnose reductase [Candidatus Omnitrophota bacterium]
MKIFLTGAAGMLAAEVIPVLRREGHELILTDINRRLPDIEALDVTDLKEVRRQIESARPDHVFHLGAETNVDLCEKDPDHAFRVNALGTENVAFACASCGARLLYISTGAVFGGEKEEPYTEFDEPGPVNIYGHSKLQGEMFVREHLGKYFIVRAGWMVGGWELDKKFVYKIIQQLKAGKRELTVVDDKFGTPTFTRDFAANILRVIGTGRYGTYHLVNKGTCSRYDMAEKIVSFMGLAGKVTMKAVGSDKYPLPAPRARSEMMRNYKLELLGENVMPVWEDSLAAYIKENKDKD